LKGQSASTGTGGWEAALTSTLSPGDKVATFRYGQFSHLWVEMQQHLGLDSTVMDCPWGEGAHEGKPTEALPDAFLPGHFG
jgi:alanine-glyoxylate transaminase/serine-glyoxylate transaminase/serine-pyruvate transaminase